MGPYYLVTPLTAPFPRAHTHHLPCCSHTRLPAPPLPPTLHSPRPHFVHYLVLLGTPYLACYISPFPPTTPHQHRCPTTTLYCFFRLPHPPCHRRAHHAVRLPVQNGCAMRTPPTRPAPLGARVWTDAVDTPTPALYSYSLSTAAPLQFFYFWLVPLPVYAARTRAHLPQHATRSLFGSFSC